MNGFKRVKFGFVAIFGYLILPTLAMSFSVIAEEKGKEEPKAIKPPAKLPLPGRPKIGREWLIARRALETEPRPGALRLGPTRINLEDFYVLKKEGKNYVLDEEMANKSHAVLQEYDSRLADLAKNWLEEIKALRKQYDEKLVQVLPEEKRKQAKKIVELAYKFDAEVREMEKGYDEERMIVREKLKELRSADVQKKLGPQKAQEEQLKIMQEHQELKKKTVKERDAKFDAGLADLVKLLDKGQLPVVKQRVPLKYLQPKTKSRDQKK